MLDCPQVTSLEEAEAPITSSLLPVTGLRRDTNGDLSEDALRTITDGLKSRGMDVLDPDTKKEILLQTYKLFCSTNQQYQFLLRDLFERVGRNEDIPKKRLEMLREKNLFMQDLLSVSRYLESMGVHKEEEVFMEGWANGGTVPTPRPGPATETLKHQQQMLESRNIMQLKRHMIAVTEEKNKVASNYLGLYGFLNLVAVGLLIYVASGSGSANN